MGVQIDLIARDPRGVLVLLEVKTQGRARLAHISRPQFRRLLRTCAFLSHWEPVELQLALVEGTKVLLLPVDALTGS
jgi:Holliday junction resolvase-like predicted endonuclease